MSISTEEKDRYLRETAIVLAREGFQTGKTDTGKLRVLLDGAPLCEVTENGGITYRNEDIIISDIVRGLVGILRGDDGRMYFQMLSHDLKALELQRLKAKAAKIPPKIRVFSFLMLMCFMLTYIVIIIYQIINSLGALF